MTPIYSILIIGYFEEIVYQSIYEEMVQETGEYLKVHVTYLNNFVEHEYGNVIDMLNASDFPK